MPFLAFDMTSTNHETRRYEFRGENKTDYYDGDFVPISVDEMDMRIDKATVGDYSIYKLTSNNPLSFRRAWAHIRRDKTDVTVFWFMRQGRMTISNQAGKHVIKAGECANTHSLKPFYMELYPDSSRLEALHVVAPSHKLYAAIGEYMEVGRPYPSSEGDLSVIERVIALLFEENEHIDPDIAEKLVETLLLGIGKTIARISGPVNARISITDQRVSDIHRYISQHFANPDLSAKKVAERCGISLRYLCHILRKHDTSFSELVWKRRLDKAHEWLRSNEMQQHSISEIGHLCGFKSSSHFSRAFKSAYGEPPRNFRQNYMSGAVGAEIVAAD